MATNDPAMSIDPPAQRPVASWWPGFRRRLRIYLSTLLVVLVTRYVWSMRIGREADWHDRLESLIFDPPAQYAAAVVLLGALLHEMWNTLGVLWSVMMRGVVLGLAILLLVGASYGKLLGGYGFFNLFWIGYSTWGRVIVPLLSAFMVIVTTGVLWLFLYFIYVSRYEPALDDPDLCEGLELPRIRPDRQRLARALHLWGRVGRDGYLDETNRDAGFFAYLASLPIALVLALPLMPAFAAVASEDWWPQAGWAVGLIFGLLAVRSLAWRTIRRAASATTSPLPVLAGGDGRTAAVPEATRRVHEAQLDAMLISPPALALATVPLLMLLLSAYVGDLIHGPFRGFRDGYHAELLGRSVVRLLTVAFYMAFLGAFLFWLTRRRLSWSTRSSTRYLLGVVGASIVPFGLAIFFSHFLGMGLASTFSLCCMLIFLGLVVVGLYRWFETSRVRVQFAAAAIFALAFWLNGFNSYKLQFQALDGYPAHAFWGPNTGLVDLARYDAWFESEVTGTEVKPEDPSGSRVARPTAPGEFGGKDLVWDHVALERWRGHTRRRATVSDAADPPRQAGKAGVEKKPKLVVVATSGGALRASIWTDKVLREIEREIPEFPDRVRIITGASGGMLGAANYVTNLVLNGRGAPQSPLPKGVGAFGGKDFWTPALHQLVFGDFITLVSPGVQHDDRGRVLEQSWRDDVTFESLGRTFADLLKGTVGGGPSQPGEERPREADGELPSLVFTPMLAEDSRRLFISNLRLDDLVMNHGKFDPFTGQDRFGPGSDFPYYSRMGVQFFHLFPKAHGTFHVSTAVRMNASFPLISPAGNLPTTPPRSVVDAGYYDNYGVDLAVSWLERHRPWLEQNTSGVVLVQIRAFTNEESLKELVPSEPTEAWLFRTLNNVLLGPIARGLGFLTTPLSGVARARQFVMSYRNDSAVDGLKRRFTLDKLAEYSGVPTRFCYQDDWKACFNDETLDRLIANYDQAQGFFRIITFTCADEQRARRRGGAELPEVETMNWMVSHQEHQNIVEKWETTSNRNRFRYLLGVFNRLVVDNPGATAAARFAAPWGSGWRVVADAKSHGGEHHERAAKDHRQLPARWTIEGLPRGHYDVYATWDEHQDNAIDARFTIVDTVRRPDHESIEVNQRRPPAAHNGSIELDGRHWRRLGERHEVRSGRLVVELSGGSSGRLVADGIHVKRAGFGHTDAQTIDDDTSPTTRFEAPPASGWRQRTMFGYGDNHHVRVPANVPDPEPARWTIEGLPGGPYEVYATWPDDGRNAPDATYDLLDDQRSLGPAVRIDQGKSPEADGHSIARDGTHWRRLGKQHLIRSGRLSVRLDGPPGGRLVADAIRIVPVPLVESKPDARAGATPPRWTFRGLPAGEYHLYVTGAKGPGRAEYTMFDGEKETGPRIPVDQTILASRDGRQDLLGDDGRYWRRLVGGLKIDSDRLRVELSGDEGGRLVPDALRVVPATSTVADDVLEPAFRAPDGWQVVDRGLDRYGVAADGSDAEKPVAVYDNFAYREAGDKALPARWTFRALPPDDYRVYVTWPESKPADDYLSPNTTKTRYTITDGACIKHASAAVNQRKSPRDHAAGGQSVDRLGRPWLRIGGVIHVTAAEGSEDGTGGLVITLESEEGGRLVADAVCVERVAK